MSEVCSGEQTFVQLRTGLTVGSLRIAVVAVVVTLAEAGAAGTDWPGLLRLQLRPPDSGGGSVREGG